MQKRSPEFAYLQYVHPGNQPKTIAVLVVDHDNDSLLMRFTDDWSGLDEDDIEVLSALGEDLYAKANELGAAALMAQLQETLSNTLRISDPQPISGDIDAELGRLENALVKRHHAWVMIKDLYQSLSSVTVYLATVVRFFKATGSHLVNCYPHMRRDVHYAAASAAVIVLIITASANVLRNSHIQVASLREDKASLAEVTDRSAHTVVTSHGLRGTLEFPSGGGSKARKRQKRTKRRSLSQAVSTQRFVPPQRSITIPKVSMMVPPDIEISSRSAALMPLLREPSMPPPPQRERTFLRILQAIAYPFKKIGVSLTN